MKDINYIVRLQVESPIPCVVVVTDTQSHTPGEAEDAVVNMLRNQFKSPAIFGWREVDTITPSMLANTDQ